MPTVAELGPDVDRGAEIAATYIVGCSMSFVFLVMRFWSRRQIRGLAIDDWCMLAAWIPFVPLTVLTSMMVLNGGTRHLQYLAAENPQHVGYLVKINWIAQPFSIFCLGMGKVAVSLLLARLLDRAAFWRKWILHGISVWTIVNTVIMIVLTFAQCRNVRALWDPMIKATTTCWDPTVQSNFSIYGSSAFTFVDFVLAFMPLTIIWRLQLDLKKKIGLAVLLGCGALTGISAAIKTSKLVSLQSRSDQTWETYDLFMWTGIEIVLVIVCGSVPTLKPLYQLALGRKGPTSTKRLYELSNGRGKSHIKENHQVKMGSAYGSSKNGISMTRTAETSFREGSEDNILPNRL